MKRIIAVMLLTTIAITAGYVVFPENDGITIAGPGGGGGGGNRHLS